MDAMTRAVKMDLILDYFKQKDLAGDLYVDYDMHVFLPTIGLTYDDDNDYDQVLKTFKDKNLIESGGNGYMLTDTGRGFKTFVAIEKQRLKDLILDAISESFDTGDYVNLNRLLILNCPEMTAHDLGKILNVLSQHGHLQDATIMVQGTTRSVLSVKKFIEVGNSVNLKISEKGYRYINKMDENKTTNGHTYNISTTGSSIVIGSENVNIGSYNNEEIAKMIPVIIDLFKDIRQEDMSLLIAAVKDHNEGKPIELSVSERIIGLLSGVATIASYIKQA